MIVGSKPAWATCEPVGNAWPRLRLPSKMVPSVKPADTQEANGVVLQISLRPDDEVDRRPPLLHVHAEIAWELDHLTRSGDIVGVEP